MNYDLEERTEKFGENIINFVNKIEVSVVNKPIIGQLIRSTTSIGANYMEANQASSKKDFRSKIQISRKEANETKYWLRMLSFSNKELADDCKIFWKEAHELTLIFAKISSSCVKNLDI
jgi:four helix bundle protein